MLNCSWKFEDVILKILTLIRVNKNHFWYTKWVMIISLLETIFKRVSSCNSNMYELTYNEMKDKREMIG